MNRKAVFTIWLSIGITLTGTGLWLFDRRLVPLVLGLLILYELFRPHRHE